MTTLMNREAIEAPGGSPAATGDGCASPGPGLAPSDASSPWHDREVRAVAVSLHEVHPEVALAEVVQMVEAAYADLASARVTSFRMILAERAVRRRLAQRSTTD